MRRKTLALLEQYLNQPVAVLLAQSLLFESVEQAFRRDIGFAIGEPFGIGDLFVENIFLRDAMTGTIPPPWKSPRKTSR